jgi:hypothetical protein
MRQATHVVGESMIQCAPIRRFWQSFDQIVNFFDLHLNKNTQNASQRVSPSVTLHEPRAHSRHVLAIQPYEQHHEIVLESGDH